LVNGVAEGYALTNHYAYLPGSDLLSGWSNGVVTVARSFEPSRDLLVHVLNMAGTNRVSQFGYLNDAIGRRTQRLDTLAGYALPVTNEFGYNSRSELTSAAMGTNKFGYVFDSIGNRELERVNLTTNVYAANALNQYANVSNGVVWTPEYDLDGNMTFLPSTSGGGAGGEGWYLQWDAENRLVSASNATEVIRYQHDYMGRRVWRAAAGITNRFDYDGWALIRERTYTETHTLTNTYFYGPDLSGSLQGAGTIGGLLARVGEGGTLYYTYDGNGNVSDLVDPTGTVRGHYEYAPFGGLTALTGDLAGSNPFRFSTKRQDESTGLLYYGYRDLDTAWGRWVSRDPIDEKGGINVYQIAHNNALNGIDPDGRYFVVLPYISPPGSPGSAEAEGPRIAALFNKLVAMCPTGDESKLLSPVKNPPQCCRPESCKEQALVFATEIVHRATLMRKAFNIKHGFPFPGGWQGNVYRNATGAASDGSDGYLCNEWSTQVFQALLLPLLKYRNKHELCFRGSAVSKGDPDPFYGKIWDWYHEWALVYGPRNTAPSFSLGVDVVAVDPWPSGGLEMSPGAPHVAVRFAQTTHIHW